VAAAWARLRSGSGKSAQRTPGCGSGRIESDRVAAVDPKPRPGWTAAHRSHQPGGVWVGTARSAMELLHWPGGPARPQLVFLEKTHNATGGSGWSPFRQHHWCAGAERWGFLQAVDDKAVPPPRACGS